MAEPNWLELPRDVTANILKRLDTIEILSSACQVCPLWWNICKDPHMWRTINVTNYGSINNKDKIVKICRNAIDRSCGRVEDIDIEYFATDDLLSYIADNCACHLRNLRLAMRGGLSDKRFSDSIKKLSQLEYLDISYQNHLSKDTFEVIGQYCPLLKTLKCSRIGKDRENDVLFAIARTMPGLHHLKICGDMPSDDGVLAILDGCPLLESLDLKECYCYFYVNREMLEKKCCENVKDFSPPSLHYSSNYDFGWGIESENWSGYED